MTNETDQPSGPAIPPLNGSLHLGRHAIPLEPKEYAFRVSEHANQSSQASLFPGQNYENLADYLWRPYGNDRPHTASRDGPTSTAGLGCFATLHTLLSKGNRIVHIDKVDEFLQHRKESGEYKENHLLFLRGFASPDWLNAVGSSYWVDPEFFQRHLEFFSIIGKRNYFPLPSMVSSASNVIRLRITTMGYRDSSAEIHNQSKLDDLRDLCAKDMENYLENIKLDGIEPGDSVVRRFSVHNNTHFSLEQDISLCITDNCQGWTIIAWLDPGKPLSEELTQADIPQIPQRRWSPLTNPSKIHPTSRPVRLASLGHHAKGGAGSKHNSPAKAQGPWHREAFSPYGLHAELHPTIQHHSGMALNAPKFALRGQGHLANTHGFHQSATLLHLGYGRTLDEETLASDAFYALHEFFTFKAFSESQFLNVVAAVMAPETSHMVLRQEEPTLSNLLYHKEILLSHAQELRSNIATIKNRGCGQWPSAKSQIQQKVACAAADTLLHDFESLLQRTELLSHRCDQGMSIIMNNAALAESRRAISQARLVGRLTLLAYFYIPLSFTSSFFGMNFSELNGGSNLHIWLYFITSIPILLLSIVFLKFNVRRGVESVLRLDRLYEWGRRFLS